MSREDAYCREQPLVGQLLGVVVVVALSPSGRSLDRFSARMLIGREGHAGETRDRGGDGRMGGEQGR